MGSFEPNAESTSLLEGVRVLSFGSFVAGNICALMLAELGADVVKVESRQRPEALRSYDTPYQEKVYEPSGVRTTALYAGLTRSVRSICIDMSTAPGRDTFRTLASRAHVVIENLAPGQMESWGCSFAELSGCTPRLVMLSISGYGKTGPLAAFRAYASNINNYLGLTSAWALDGTHFDFVAGIHGASAVVAALVAAERGGQGVFVDLAEAEAGASLMAPLYLEFLANGREWDAAPNEVPGALLSEVLRCRGDDAWLALELEDAGDWNAVCRYLSRSDLVLQDGEVTPERRTALLGAIEDWTRSLSPFQAAFRLQKIGLAAGPVQNSEDIWRDGQLRSRAAFVEVTHPDVGLLEYPAMPARLSTTPGRVRSPGPRLGEHTGEVLGEWANVGEADVIRLQTSGAVWQAESASPRSPRPETDRA
jgi:benzylsuccinate CoA-transferase BbsF subunit